MVSWRSRSGRPRVNVWFQVQIQTKFWKNHFRFPIAKHIFHNAQTCIIQHYVSAVSEKSYASMVVFRELIQHPVRFFMGSHGPFSGCRGWPWQNPITQVQWLCQRPSAPESGYMSGNRGLHLTEDVYRFNVAHVASILDVGFKLRWCCLWEISIRWGVYFNLPVHDHRCSAPAALVALWAYDSLSIAIAAWLKEKEP